MRGGERGVKGRAVTSRMAVKRERTGRGTEAGNGGGALLRRAGEPAKPTVTLAAGNGRPAAPGCFGVYIKRTDGEHENTAHSHPPHIFCPSSAPLFSSPLSHISSVLRPAPSPPPPPPPSLSPGERGWCLFEALGWRDSVPAGLPRRQQGRGE